MGIEIKSAGISNDKSIFSPMEQSIMAAENCIAASDITKEEIDLLIYLGIYRDDNIAEPALASIVQKRLRINPDPALDHGTPTTFSFDMMAGGASAFLYAVQVVDSMIGAGFKKNALIVTCDSHPSKGPAPDFPFSSVGSAVLLSASKNDKGFTNLMFKTSEVLNESFYSYNIVNKMGTEGRKKMYFDIREDYNRHLFEFTLSTIRENIKSGKIDIKKINHVIVSNPLRPYVKQLADEFRITEDSFVLMDDEYGDPHTSALPVCYYTGCIKKMFKINDTILFIGAASGLTCACGVYAL
jgi:3-oxoacyl-[acyl-carrier-protein] synthase III